MQREDAIFRLLFATGFYTRHYGIVCSFHYYLKTPATNDSTKNCCNSLFFISVPQSWCPAEVGNGTRIIIFNLLRANGSLELDTETSEYDLQIQAFKGEDVADRNMKMAALRQRQTISSFKENPIRTSLRVSVDLKKLCAIYGVLALFGLGIV